MLKKKALITVAAAAAVVMANPILNKAHAASFSPTAQEKVYVYKASNMDEFNSIIEKYLASLGMTISHNTVQQPAGTQTQEPVQTPQTEQTAPSTEQPAPAPTTEQTPQASTTPVQQEPAPAETATTTASTYSLSAYEQKVVDLTNQERAKNGLPALKVDLTLSKMARDKSQDMSTNHYFSHTSPTYGSPFDMMKKYGITYHYAGENIAMGQRTPEEVVTAWMNSDGHRKNILSPNFNYIGVGYVADGNYWTQEFIGK